MAIPAVLVYFITRRRDLPFPVLFWLFGLFIVSCGFTHLLEGLAPWVPLYRLAALVKLVTALASWGTVACLVPLVPRALALTSPHELEREVARRTAELAQTNQALRASEGRFRQLADAMPQIVWTARPDGYLDYYNERWYEFTGFPRGEGGDQSWKPILHPDDVQKCLDVWYRAVHSGQPYEIEYRFFDRHTGDYRWHLGRALPVRGPGGEVVRWYGTSTDIHEQKCLAEELAEAVRHKEETLALLDTLLRTAPVGFAFLDRQLRYVHINETLAAMNGWPADAHLGQTITDLLPHLAATLEPLFRRVLDSGQPAVGLEISGERPAAPDQRGHWLASYYPVHAPGRETLGVGVVVVDVTERKAAEEEVRRLNESLERQVQERTTDLARQTALLQSVIHSMAEGLVVSDPDGRFTLFNSAAERILGVGALAVRPEEWSERYALYLPDAVTPYPAEQLPLARAIRGEVVDDTEVFVRRTEGQGDVWISCTARPLRNEAPPPQELGGGRGGGGLVVFRDTTERKHLENDLHRAKEAAEAASRAKGAFLANMSHEIRTPMNGILGMIELALDTDLSAEQRDYLQTVQSSAQSLLRILNDILDFSKIEAGKLELSPIPFPLRDSLADMLKPLAPRAHAKGLELACRVAPDVPDLVVGDADRLRQIVVNLVGNAIKFTERGEVVVMVQAEGPPAKTQRRKEEKEETGRDEGLSSPASLCGLASLREVLLHFAVVDSGIGIPSEKVQAIFAPFAQADSSTTRKYGGTGLGLSISARLVELLGGRIWVESEPGRGSTFHFTVRLTREADPVEGNDALDRGGLPVLVVDDNVTSARILSEMLSDWGLQAATVAGAAEARAELSRAEASGEPYPVLLLDAFLPGADGLSRELQRAEAVGPAVLLLSPTGQADSGPWRDLRVSAVLSKPPRPSELRKAVQAALTGARREQGPVAAPARKREPRSGALRILLAEDNPVNQRVATLLLRQEGHEVAVAGNGREALAALEGEPFDLALMDVQMPEMDGLQATAQLRRREKETGRHVPIIAMTAHALKGDRERCLQAGMDGYLPKPIQAEQLWREIQDLLPRVSVPEVVAAPLPVSGVRSAPEEVFDRDACLARARGDVGFLQEVVGLFRDGYPRLLGEIRAALQAGDAGRARRAAHTLNGSVGFFRAGRASEAALRLEALACAGDLVAAEEALGVLTQAVEELDAALTKIKDEG